MTPSQAPLQDAWTVSHPHVETIQMECIQNLKLKCSLFNTA